MTDTADYRLPPTISTEALSDGGSDTRFRQMVYDLLTVSLRMEKVREALAKTLGVTSPQYSILMAIARLEGAEGVPVNLVANQLHVTGPFVTVEAGKLVRRGLVEKRRNRSDARSVLLRLSSEGERHLTALAPAVCSVNDRFFGALDRSEFLNLARITTILVRDSEAAVAIARNAAAGETTPFPTAPKETVFDQL